MSTAGIPVDAASVDATPGAATPADLMPTNEAPSSGTQADGSAADSTPTDSTPTDSSSTDGNSTDGSSTDGISTDTTWVDSAQATQVDAIPADSTPIDINPAGATPTDASPINAPLSADVVASTKAAMVGSAADFWTSARSLGSTRPWTPPSLAGWLHSLWFQQGTSDEAGTWALVSDRGGPGLPPRPTKPASPSYPPFGSCTGTRSGGSSSSPFADPVLSGDPGPALARPNLFYRSPVPMLEVTHVSLIEQPG